MAAAYRLNNPDFLREKSVQTQPAVPQRGYITMAEITPSAQTPQKTKVRAKKMSVRIDFTPMVDLGFLLITFFMLTTTLAKPQIMALVMPDDVEPVHRDPLKESKVLTLLLGANDKVYWYEGVSNPTLDSVGYDAKGLRKVILNKMGKVADQWGLETYQDSKTKTEKQGSKLYVLIKPTKDSRYKNMVDVLDEMAVCGVRYYVIMDISAKETAFIQNPSMNNLI